MYEMKPEYYIGIDMIDEEHKQLFKYADDAYELLHDENTPDKYDRIDMILEDLRDYTAKHFNDEEQYMESINYKKLFTQKMGQSFFSWDCHHIVYWLVTPPLTGWKSNAVRLLPTAKNSRTI